MKTQIKKIRGKLEMTQEELAETVDVTRQTIIALEQGNHNPSLILAIKVSRALHKRHVEEIFEIEQYR